MGTDLLSLAAPVNALHMDSARFDRRGELTFVTHTYQVELEADEPTLEALRARGLFVASTQLPKVFSDAAVSCLLPDGQVVEWVGQVVNHTPTGFYVLFATGIDLDPIIEQLEASSGHGSGEETEELDSDPQTEASDDLVVEGAQPRVPQRPQPRKPHWQIIDTASELSVRKQIAVLSVADKLRLARGAKRPVRTILVRDLEKRVHLEVVKNPQVTDDEIFEYSGITNLSPSALRWIANQERHVRRLDLRMNLILNRNTPQDLALKLMKSLPTGSLRRILRSSKAREALQRAARKKLMTDGIM